MSRRFERGSLQIALLMLAITWTMAVPPSAGQETNFFAPERLVELSERERLEWEAYLERSREDADRDRAFIERELARVGAEEPVPAPGGRAPLITDRSDPAWFAGDEARRIAGILLTYQTPSGGWSKNVDFRVGEREKGGSFFSGDGWSYIGTFDNDATTEELRFLAKTFMAQGGTTFREAFERGLRYILRAQFPNGCWPQVYPLQGGYHDAATFNDEAIPNILELLRRVAAGEFGFVYADLRRDATAAKERGIDCILRSQVSIEGVRTAWAQQYDPIALTPTRARAYEHPALTAGESVEVVEFLMGVEDPSDEVVQAVHAAVEWFQEVALYGIEYVHPRLTEREGAGPVWARFYEMGTNRPIFSNRDGRILYDWHELDDERRRGYGWYRYGPADVLARFDTWSKNHPRP